jgi:hypothetical protein
MVPHGAAWCRMYQCREGCPKTVADGLKMPLGDLTFPVIRDLVDAIICVSEADIIASTRLVWERMKLVCVLVCVCVRACVCACVCVFVFARGVCAYVCARA